jgi:hypothetical protein
MLRQAIEPRIVVDGLLAKKLTPEQASALLGEDRTSSTYFLSDRVSSVLQDPSSREVSTLFSPAGRLLELFWQFHGAAHCVAVLPHFGVPIIENFLRVKLKGRAQRFSDEDLENLERTYWDKPFQQTVVEARARRLAPLADLLLRNPVELNQDVAEVKNRVSAYSFTPELNEVLDKVAAGLATTGDPFDQAAMLKHLRTFYEKLHEQVGTKLRAEKVGPGDATDLTKCGQAIDYLQRHGVLTEKMKALGRALYGVLSEEGVHSLKSDKEYVRLCRNWIAEYALVLFFELDRALGK